MANLNPQEGFIICKVSSGGHTFLHTSKSKELNKLWLDWFIFRQKLWVIVYKHFYANKIASLYSVALYIMFFRPNYLKYLAHPGAANTFLEGCMLVSPALRDDWILRVLSPGKDSRNPKSFKVLDFIAIAWDKNIFSSYNYKIQISTVYTRWIKYDRDKLWLVYTQIVPVIFEPPCILLLVCATVQSGKYEWICCHHAKLKR